ncbi:MAG: hypothetical protein HDS44_03285 [Bacteroides sp.]|nr:hypothetical protein [Bacteroides sp.]MBD5300368.1 hypothetical protein [Bacteroides sp.]MBD5318442.1 hypothetical protein [Bacteroides sp.]
MKKILLVAAASAMFMAATAQTVIAPPTLDEAKEKGFDALWGDYQFGYVLPNDYTLVDDDAVKVVMNNGSTEKPGANISTSSLNTTVFDRAFNMGSSANYGKNGEVYNLADVSNGIKQPYAIFAVTPKVGGELTMYTNRGKNKYTIYVWDTTINDGEGAYVLASSTHTDSYGKELISKETVGLIADHTYWVFASETGANTLMYEMVYTPYSSENYSVKEFDATKFSTVIAPPALEVAKEKGYEALWGDYQFGYVLPNETVLADSEDINVVMNNGSTEKPGANISTSGINTTVFESAFNMGSSANYGKNGEVYNLADVSNGIKQPYAIFAVTPKVGGELTMFTNRGKNKYTIYVWDTTINDGEGAYVLASSTHTDSYGKELISKETVGLIADHTYWIFASETGANTFMYAMGYNSYASPNYGYQSDSTSAISDVIVNEMPQSDVIYNVLGQKVDENYKGLVIKNGKKYIQR